MLVFTLQRSMDGNLKLYPPLRRVPSVTAGSKSTCWVELDPEWQSGTLADTPVGHPQPSQSPSASPTEMNSKQPTLSQLDLALTQSTSRRGPLGPSAGPWYTGLLIAWGTKIKTQRRSWKSTLFDHVLGKLGSNRDGSQDYVLQSPIMSTNDPGT